MKAIRMLVSETGHWPDGGQYHVRGGRVYTVPGEVPREIADAWIARGFAELAGRQPESSEPAVPNFASDEAAEAWHEAGRPALTGEPSGKTGFTVADVDAATEPEE